METSAETDKKNGGGNSVVFKANIVVKVKFWANALLFGENSVIYYANTVVIQANTVVVEAN